MAFFHGVRTRQVPTSLIPAARVNASLVMAFGTAPIHRLSPEAQAAAMPGNIILAFSNADAGQFLGIDSTNDNFGKWGLSEVAFSQFTLFGVAPVIFANVFDPNVHNKQVTNESLLFVQGTTTLANPDLIGNLTLTDTDSVGYSEEVDYTINRVTGVVNVVENSPLEAALAIQKVITAQYRYAAPELATPNDCIGGFDVATGISTGLELVEVAFPRFSMIPGILLCPNFSVDPTVAAIMSAKTQNINGVFNAVAFADIPSEDVTFAGGTPNEVAITGVTLFSNAPEYKNKNNLLSPDLYVCYPKVRFGSRTMNMSTQAAGIVAGVDSANGDIPFASPSNKNLQCQAAVSDGEEIWLSLTQANFLNANGITTALNFVGGWKLWGNRTAAFPAATDPKDVFLPSRRILAWYGNRLVLTWFQRVDFPINRRLIQTILNSEAISINSLTAAGAITGGRIEFNQEQNSILDLMDGKITFHVLLGLVAPAESIEFLLEYDPAYLETLFS
jgi:phage tail sheath protein FI